MHKTPNFMEIANPIYDVVFKYLMEDNKVAKIFLSAITGLEITNLEFIPQELVVDKTKTNENKFLTALNLSVYRLDFSAKVREADGSEKLIIIELQKSKFAHETMRFRKYLGKQYMNDSLFQWIRESTGKKFKMGIPILPIYILGERLPGFEHIPIISVDRCIRDQYTQEIYGEANHFIESLFHKGIIINVPAISQKRRNELEMLLSIFDQDNRMEDHHILNVVETDFPERFRPIIRRLQAANLEKDVRDTMDIEDDLLKHFNEYEHRIAEEVKEKEEQRHLKEEERRQKEEERRQKEEERRQKEEERRQKEEERRQKEEAIKMLLQNGIPAEAISADLKIPLEDVLKLRKNSRKK